MEFLFELGLFAAKTLLIVGSVILVIGAIFFFAARSKDRSQVAIEKLNEHYSDLRALLQMELLSKKELKEFNKQEKKARKDDEPKDKRAFVLDFDGDLKASEVENLREEVTAVVAAAKAGDEVILRLESPGGLVTSYGLATSQLIRLRDAKLRLTICVDKVAASGGYMMACVADRILAAPFAVVGSIGVVAQVPNINRLLKKHDVDFREVTAGEYKRTVSVMGEITEKGMEKFREQLEDTHVLFKNHVSHYRPTMDISKVATGEYWYGTQAVGLGLVDTIQTSDDYLYKLHETTDLIRIQYITRKKFSERVSESLSVAAHSLFQKVWGDLSKARYGV